MYRKILFAEMRGVKYKLKSPEKICCVRPKIKKMKKSSFSLFPFIALLCILLTSVTAINAQPRKKYLHDSAYYDMYPGKWAARIYMSQKLQQITIPATGNAQNIQYRGNTKLNLGVGVTWHNYTLNGAYGFGFLNKDAEKGKTKGLNLQLHTFPHKWAIDLLVVLPKGFYISPKGYASNNSSTYYYRPDVVEKIYGASAYRVPNKEKFSYRAALNQFEWQKKSAGSLLYGGEAYYGLIEGDSALVPKAIQTGFPQAGITEMRFITFGPGIGYAYTLVMAQHFFISASLTGNLDISFIKEEAGTATTNKKVTVGPSAVAKAAIGYNSSDWAFAASFTGNAFWLKGPSAADPYFLPSGAFKVALSKKMFLHKSRRK